MDFHIGSKGTEVRFAAGYLNRAARRRLMKKKHVHYKAEDKKLGCPDN